MLKDDARRLRFEVRGVVQGVGFRPFVYRIASERGLAGWVLNSSAGVSIEVEGPFPALESFRKSLSGELPPQARIDGLAVRDIPPEGESGFRILESRRGDSVAASIPADLALCPDCLAEMRNPADRRYLYPFTNCTNCGPRFTIVKSLPYDRPLTTMAGFRMCPECGREYADPLNRRFHAQPNACPVCGPQAYIIGRAEKGADAIKMAASVIAGGGIAAIKGIGGFHLACDAENRAAVAMLRRGKERPFKPFALMADSVATVRRYCAVSAEEERALSSAAAPVVMLSRKDGVLADAVPNLESAGFMLPYAPLHVALFIALENIGFSGRPLVMTSGNRRDESVSITDDEALSALSGIADVMLSHDRPIHNRCDDSVGFMADGVFVPIRRARGFVPSQVPLSRGGQSVLAAGAELKNTFCLTRGQEAFLSQHIGDLEEEGNISFWRESRERMSRLLGVEPGLVVCDSHPDYHSSRLAREMGLPVIAVQHHAAHIASVMAEHGLEERVAGAALDGTGFGSDGTIWGGEFIVMEGDGKWRRAGHLKPVPLPGGDVSALRIWRMGLSWLLACGGRELLAENKALFAFAGEEELEVSARLCETGFNSPLTSSMGRLFDAAAFFCGVQSEVSFEGEAAMRLQALCRRVPTEGYRFDIVERGDVFVADPRPVIEGLVSDRGDIALAAERFHFAVAEMTARMLCMVADRAGTRKTALSGGVFQNRILLGLCCDMVRKNGLEVYRNRLVPANDGGLSLGQAWLALSREK